MSLTKEAPRWESAFDVIVCPVCGSQAWKELPMQGIFCEDCNCKAQLRSTTGDRGFIVDFDADNCWNTTTESQQIPAHSTMGRMAYAKYHGTDETGYKRAFLSVYAFIDEEVSRDSWMPAWNR